MAQRPAPPLARRVPEWIAREASPAAARQFSGWVLRALRDVGHDPLAPADPETFAAVKTELRRADLTPDRMQRAVREARRAEEKGHSTLQWAQAVQARALGTEEAEVVFQLAKARLKSEFGATEKDLSSPPTPEETFAFFLAWEELGGTSVLSALQELRRQKRGGLSQN